MQFLVSSETTAIAAILALLIFIYTFLFVSRIFLRNTSKNRACSAPEAGGAWPVIGHLHLLGGPEPPHRVLGNMTDKYGPIFTIKMGVHRALVVSNWETAKECLSTRDKIFASRPKTLAMELLGYNFSMFPFSPYGSYWRQIRKIATVELLSNHRLASLKHVRESEVKTSLKALYDVWDKEKSSSSNKVLVDMRRWLGDLTLNVILRIIIGKRCDSQVSGDLKEEVTRFFEMSGRFVVSDGLPFLRWMDIGGDERSMKKIAKELDTVLQGWLEEHKRKRDSGEMKGVEDFMDVMLSILDDAEQFPDRDADTINKAMCLSLMLAGTDTTSVALTWILSLLLNHGGVLKKAQNEIDIHIGTKRFVNESDMKNLIYIQAIIKEAMRLYPSGPLALPHEAMEDCIVRDYFVPAGTRLLINIWKIHRDPQIWTEPNKFQPERFLTTHKDFDVRGQNFEFIPFGSGRRMCPGISFALQVTQLTLAAFLQGFDFATLSDEPVDMSEGLGLTLAKATPLQVLVTPRLPSSVYC